MEESVEKINEMNSEEDIEANEYYDDSSEYVKAKTFPIDENWPDEIKQQVQTLNQMAAMINAEPEEDSETEEETEDDDIEDEEEEEEENNNIPAVNTEETETFDDVF